MPGLKQCPYCGSPLDPTGSNPRAIIEVAPVRKEVIRYELAQRDCGRCHRTFTARPAGVFAKGLFGNQLLTHLAVEHYVQGVTLGHLSAHLAVGQGGLWAALHQLARRLAEVPQRLLLEYRRTPVKHADETGWRNDGHNGYAGLFCTPRISLFRFRQTRSASVPHERPAHAPQTNPRRLRCLQARARCVGRGPNAGSMHAIVRLLLSSARNPPSLRDYDGSILQFDALTQIAQYSWFHSVPLLVFARTFLNDTCDCTAGRLICQWKCYSVLLMVLRRVAGNDRSRNEPALTR